MKKFILALSVFTLLIAYSHAQSLQTGIDFYEEGNYEQAIRIFEKLDQPEAYLFMGKSYFGLNNYMKAKHFLNKVDSTAGIVYKEAKYTRALADFQLKNFALSLDALYEIKESSQRSPIILDASRFYNDLLNYLSPKQRHHAFKASSYDKVRFDLMESAIGIVDYGTARALFQAYQKTVTETDTPDLSDLRALLNDSTSYFREYNPNRYVRAPEGISYNIGVALPEFDIETPDFEISQHLYFGIQLAVENFNSENTDKKVFINFKNTGAGVRNASGVVSEMIWTDDMDAVIGPLFSEVALEFSRYSELYEVPMLTPLANSDSLNLDRNYTFQLNPTFAVQGKKMAEYAVNTLGYDTLAVIAEKGSLGESSAHAFLDEARMLGAEVVYFFVEDFKSRGYDISDYVQYFNPRVDTVANYNIDAVYAPFTGNVAATLINSLVTNLEAIGGRIAVLGSEEWETINFESTGLRNTALYYTETFRRKSGKEIQDFESAFRLRFDINPNRFAFIGFDAANVLLENLKRVQNPAYLKEGLKSFNNYKGLIIDVSFKDTHINQEVKVRQVR